MATDRTFKCPACGAAHTSEEWKDTYMEFECDLCGTHNALECQTCHRTFDEVYTDLEPADGD